MAQKNADPQVSVRPFGNGHWAGLKASAFADAFAVVGLADPDLGLDELGERLSEFVIDDLVLDHDQLFKEGLIDEAPELLI